MSASQDDVGRGWRERSVLGRGSAMTQILTDGGCECQSQEQGKGCHSHVAGEAKGSQMEAK